jgi:hypothetical protein
MVSVSLLMPIDFSEDDPEAIQASTDVISENVIWQPDLVVYAMAVQQIYQLFVECPGVEPAFSQRR